MRLRDIDSTFFGKYEHRMSSGGQTPPEKDFFEPGVPDDLVKPSHVDQDSGQLFYLQQSLLMLQISNSIYLL